MLLLSTSSLHRYGLNRIFHFAKRLGFQGIELVVNDIADTRDADYIRDLQQQYDLPVFSIVTPQKSTIEKTKSVIDLADALNTGTVVIRSPLWSEFGYASWLRSNIPRFAKIYSRQICFENPPRGESLVLPKYAFGNINEIAGFKNLALDTTHLFSRQLDLMRVYERHKSVIRYIRLSDTRRGSEHLLPGDGILPLESFLAHLAKDKYTGGIAIKVDYQQAGADDPKEVEKNLGRVKKFFDEFYR